MMRTRRGRRRWDCCYYSYRSNSYRFDNITSLPLSQAILVVALDTHRNPILPPPSTTPSWTCPSTPGGAEAAAAAGCDCSATVAAPNNHRHRPRCSCFAA